MSTADSPARVIVTGASGRMGEALIDAAGDREDVLIVAGVARNEAAATADVPVGTDLEATLDGEAAIDAVVDFTAPEATASFAGVAADHGAAFVTGTTGLAGHDADPVGALDAASDAIPVLHASNFSRSVSYPRYRIRSSFCREAWRMLP